MSVVNLSPVMGIRDEVAALKRERTIAVAAELFYEWGYENTSLDSIAERMNVTKPFIYVHFSSKAELLAEICSRGIASSLASLEGVLSSMPGSPRDRLQEVGRQFVAAVLNSQRYIAIFAREEKNLAPEDFSRISDMRRTFDHRLVQLLDEGVAAGEFAIDDTRIAALAIGGMISWAYVWYRPNGRLTLDKTSAGLTSLILKLAGAAAAKPAKPAKTSPRARTSRTAATAGRSGPG